MKNFKSTLAAVALIALSTILGVIAANSAIVNRWVLGDAIRVPSEIQAEPAQPGWYVQEPPSRTSFRPDFSTELRHSHQRNNFFMRRAFNEAIGDKWKSTVRILNEAGQQLALGAVVGSEGWILTKASELPLHEPLVCQMHDNSTFNGECVQTVLDLDLALVHVECSGLPTVAWNTEHLPERGHWLATTDIDEMASAVGVISAGEQQIAELRAVLGVSLGESEFGAEVISVLAGSGAERAGIYAGDLIVGLNGESVPSRAAFMERVAGLKGGQQVELSVVRGEEQFDYVAQLMDLPEELWDETEMEVNGPISARSTGFGTVFTHDTVLKPNQCGGPVIDLDGQIVGINIARAGRVATYALPAKVVKPVVDSLLRQAQLVSRPLKTETAESAIR